MPDVEQLEVIDERHFRAVVKPGIGPVRGKFGFDVAWQELDEPSHARMTAQGQDGGQRGDGRQQDGSDARPADGGTDLAWSADVVVHGMIASVGARLLDGFAKKQTEQFFACLQNRLDTATA